jgi:transposase-like protein
MSRDKKYYYNERTKKKIVAEYLDGSVSMNKRARLYGIMGSNTIGDWLRKYGNFNSENIRKKMKSTNDIQDDTRKEMARKHRKKEQFRISELEMDLDDSRRKLQFYKCALDIINELALEMSGIDRLKKLESNCLPGKKIKNHEYQQIIHTLRI